MDRSTSRRASNSAGSRPGRRKVSTRPTRTRARELCVYPLPAAERHRRPPPRPRPPALARRRARALAADAGLNVLFQPGYDHAGISTQNAVEKHLASEGTTRQRARARGVRRARLGVAARVRRQDHVPVPADRRLDRLPARCASRWTTATSAPSCGGSSTLYERGWIYRDNRIINWCPYHQTSLSDLELEHVEVDDALTYVRYPFADGDGHVDDRDGAARDDPRRRRRRGASGRRALPRRSSASEVVVPFVERRVPVIADERVEIGFGTGALKITPGPRSDSTSRSAATTVCPS